MPLIQITMGAGRTAEQKRELLSAISQAAHETTGTPLAAVRAWIVEVPADELMIAGETLAERQSAGNAH
ncbi:tautomerase family protein [Georgenia yuyongxinii]|uniref:Tautomerase n=1 Tax=Georgenia yuyongxinii TaxID=2589797 RepID=A0A552WUP5_9MICO|nr:2-hydroxymuconate tautomerase family protein [Georgenia yuyongxinii]TRW46571.1 4-oxalocrotonate tautomerase [Georgenia yuyongxinii]